MSRAAIGVASMLASMPASETTPEAVSLSEHVVHHVHDVQFAGMATVSSAEFRSRQSEYLARAEHEPIEIMSRGSRRRAVLVSADFYDRACIALGETPYAEPPLGREE
jgi:prevent-host-death family protein